MNTAEIIRNVTMTLFINRNINISISVDWVVKTPCLFYFRSKVSLCQRNKHDASSLLANVGENFCSISAQKTTKQIFLKTDLLTENTESDLKVHALHYANELLVRVRLAFLKLLQTRKRAETTRNYQKQVLVMIKHCLGNSQINSIPE